jgi:ComF family protein
MTRWFPPRCLLCGDAGWRGRALCAGCDADLPRITAACQRCGEALPATGPGLPELTVCGACLWRPPPFTAIEVPFAYAAPIDWCVRRLKFHRDLAAGRLLGALLADAVGAAPPAVSAVVPVPLHARRLLERGFNQAEEIARPVARALGVPLAVDGLERALATPAQMELPADRRRANVRGAFAPGRHSLNGTVLLVDDVVTTASTVREASRALLRAGADGVRVLAAARA